MFELEVTPPLEEIHSKLFEEKQVQVFIKREDQIHPEVSGNKWRKLKYNFLKAQELGFQKILTFGGAYSNHIAATAAAARMYGFKSTGIIRGDELSKNSNSTLQKAHQDGMELIFVSRDQYRQRENQDWIKELQKAHHALIIPEGGSNDLAVLGVKEAVKEIDIPFDFVVCPCGTGGTLAGIVSGLNANQRALGFSVLKGLKDMETSISRLSRKDGNQFDINHDYHFGGYGKFDSSLMQFILGFYNQNSIPLDPIYTGKMMYGLHELIKKDHFPRNSSIVAIHTGGLQGIAGFNKKHEMNLPE